MTPSELWDRAVDSACRALVAAFPNRARVVPKADDPSTPLLIQFMIWPGRLYLQHFVNPESPLVYHVHRWHFMRSIVLSGHFLERRLTILPDSSTRGESIHHEAITSYTMDRNVVHHVTYWSSQCWTLFYMSKERDDAWGYYELGPRGKISELIPWRTYIQQRVPSLETGEVVP